MVSIWVAQWFPVGLASSVQLGWPAVSSWVGQWCLVGLANGFHLGWPVVSSWVGQWLPVGLANEEPQQETKGWRENIYFQSSFLVGLAQAGCNQQLEVTTPATETLSMGSLLPDSCNHCLPSTPISGLLRVIKSHSISTRVLNDPEWLSYTLPSLLWVTLFLKWPSNLRACPHPTKTWHEVKNNNSLSG